MATYQILSWDGIPTGVKAKDGEGEARENLPPRFQAAVDAAAAITGKMSSADYLAGFRWGEATERAGTAREVARLVAAELVEAFPPERVKVMRRELEARLTAD
jgi:hypothetical protein